MIQYYRRGPKNRPVYFRKQTDADGHVSISRSKCFLDRKIINGQEFFFIYNSKQQLFLPAYHYLNYHLSGAPYNTKYQKACDFRLLWAFLELEPTVDIENLDLQALMKFIFFLKSTSSKGTRRDNKNVNAILDNITPMFEGANSDLRWDALTEVEDVVRNVHYDGNGEIQVRSKKRKNRLKAGNNRDERIPAYITPEQFLDILDETKRNGDREGEILVRLMFEGGLRIGECFGLTIEDIITGEESGKTYYAVLIRNRPTDRKYQCAKCKPRILDEEECKTATYEADTDTVYIDASLYYLIMNYLEDVHSVEFVKHKKQYEEGYASSVNESDFKNHYVFLNSKGRILKPKEWNERLRKYFTKLGIIVDEEKKRNGLNHRFRHGFAMFALKYWEKPPTPLQLKRLLRHKRLSSTLIYTRCTIEDDIELRSWYIEELYKIAPGLKYEFNLQHIS